MPENTNETILETQEETESLPEAAVNQLPIPNYIFDVLCKELDALDNQINALSQKTAELTAKYTDISKFIKEYKRP